MTYFLNYGPLTISGKKTSLKIVHYDCDFLNNENNTHF